MAEAASQWGSTLCTQKAQPCTRAHGRLRSGSLFNQPRAQQFFRDLAAEERKGAVLPVDQPPREATGTPKWWSSRGSRVTAELTDRGCTGRSLGLSRASDAKLELGDVALWPWAGGGVLSHTLPGPSPEAANFSLYFLVAQEA